MSRVALVYNLNRGETEHETEFDSTATIDMLNGIISERHTCIPIEATRDMAWVQSLVASAPDLVFNTAEGFHGAAREAVYPAVFEQLGLAYCGPDPTNLTLTLNKNLTTKLVRASSIPDLEIPESYLWSAELDPAALRRGAYILKLMHEGSSIGMQLVQDSADIPGIARALEEEYRQPVVIEEFVPGVDVSMAYVEGLGILGPARIDLPDGEFYDYSLKSSRDTEVVISPHSLSPELSSKLRHVASAMMNALDLKGYSKIDFRLHDDSIHFIEINGQVSFHPDGEFANCCRADGHELSNVIHFIIDAALATNRIASVGIR